MAQVFHSGNRRNLLGLVLVRSSPALHFAPSPHREGLRKAEKFAAPLPPPSLSFLRQVKRLLPISPTDRRKVGEFVFRQPAVIQPETSLLDCLNLFQTKKTHLAFVTQHSAELESYIGKCTAAIHSSPAAASSGTSVVYPRSSQPTLVIIAVGAVLTARLVATARADEARVWCCR